MEKKKHYKGFYKFNVNGAAMDKPGPPGIGRVAHDDRGRMVLVFSEPEAKLGKLSIFELGLGMATSLLKVIMLMQSLGLPKGRAPLETNQHCKEHKKPVSE